jgi:hypothetical protein
MRFSAPTLVIAAFLTFGTPRSSAVEIYVMGNGDNQVEAVVGHLRSMGHTVTKGWALDDYSAYDQIWNFEFWREFTDRDTAAMRDFLANGGCMCIVGESGRDNRNNGIVNWVFNVGGGDVFLEGTEGVASQAVTAYGQMLNFPHVFFEIWFNPAHTVAFPTQGFSSPRSGRREPDRCSRGITVTSSVLPIHACS